MPSLYLSPPRCSLTGNTLSGKYSYDFPNRTRLPVQNAEDGFIHFWVQHYLKITVHFCISEIKILFLWDTEGKYYEIPDWNTDF